MRSSWCVRGLYIDCVPSITFSVSRNVDEMTVSLFTYFQLFGTPPFSGNTPNDIFQSILSGKMEYPKGSKKQMSKSCIQFIEAVLCPKSDRMRADEALQHDFICGDGASSNCIKTARATYVASLEVLYEHVSSYPTARLHSVTH